MATPADNDAEIPTWPTRPTIMDIRLLSVGKRNKLIWKYRKFLHDGFINEDEENQLQKLHKVTADNWTITCLFHCIRCCQCILQMDDQRTPPAGEVMMCTRCRQQWRNGERRLNIAASQTCYTCAKWIEKESNRGITNAAQ
jgi:hypothetical protein